MKKTILSGVIALTLSACSSKVETQEVIDVVEPQIAEVPAAPPTVEVFEPRWERADATVFDVEQQLSRCRYDVGMNAANIESSKVTVLIDDCMKKEGYRWVTE